MYLVSSCVIGHNDLPFSREYDGEETNGNHCIEGCLSPRALFNDTIGNEVNAKRLDLLVMFVVPEAALNFANMRRAEEEHQETRNADTSSV